MARLKIRERRDRSFKVIMKMAAPAVKDWYEKSVIQFLKEHEYLSEDQENLIMELSDFCEGRLESPTIL